MTAAGAEAMLTIEGDFLSGMSTEKITFRGHAERYPSQPALPLRSSQCECHLHNQKKNSKSRKANVNEHLGIITSRIPQL